MSGVAGTKKAPVKNRLRLRTTGGSHQRLKRPYLTAFLASLLCAALFILPFTLARGGILYVSNDQITQQIPFAQQVVKNLHGGRVLYDFVLDLGSGLVEGYAWYNLGSVFTLFYLLFPAALTPYLMAPALMLKFACGGLFAFLWLRRYTKGEMAALCGSLLYTFSGLAITNMVFPFADVYALFPLLPLAMDEAMEGQRRGFFAVAVALNLLVNPPLFFGAAVFMGLYFAVKWLYRQYQPNLRQFLILCLEALCGLLLSAFILLPFVSSLAANPRVGGMLPFGKGWFVYIAYRYFEILRSLILPAEVMHVNSMMVPSDAVSPELYLPLFGLVPVFSFLLYKRRHWLRGLLLASFICLLVPVLNSAFNAFNATYYTRWLYLPLLAAALAVALFLEDDSLPLKGGFFLWGLFALLFSGCMVLWCTVYGYPGFVNHWPLFIINNLVAAAGLVATAYSRRIWRFSPKVLCALVGLFAVATGAVNLWFNQQEAIAAHGPLNDLPPRLFYAGRTVPLPEGSYRINSPISNTYFDKSSPFSFNSTVPPGVFELQAAFGRQRTSISRIEYDEPGLWALLGVQYLLVPPGETSVPLPNTRPYADSQPFALVENLDALPLVIGFSSAIRPEDAAPLDNTQKSIVLLHGLVLEEADRELLPGLTPLEGPSLPGLDYASGLAARKAASASRVTMGKSSFEATLTMEKGGAALITLPYDASWKCEVNGVAVPVAKADWGLMAIPCLEGENHIVMRYQPASVRLGLWLTAAGLAGLGLLVFSGRRRRAKNQ